ncbi:hypothetical protein BGZ99_001146 [Dissophora globulifera]|uniref:FAD-binding domain-containing protein n=1 Tax=Dissophora globulifera TaxID=979702 RepID=A0A9P6R0I0_9FUNG|nr:hypothetical protein BGZ99_001146 [Dissophora globulifera]
MSDNPKPEVMIVGAGLGGMMLAILLERMNVPYHVYERATVMKPLGAAMAMSVNIIPVFEQLGLLEKLMAISVDYVSSTVYDHKLNVVGVSSMRNQKEICGYDKILFPRPELQQMMLEMIPPEKITYGKRVLRTEEKEDRILIHCSDNTSYVGDILIGADGAHSSVRQSIYKQLESKGLLPQPDTENLAMGYNCMVGVTNPLDPAKYPKLLDDNAHFNVVLGKERRSWGTNKLTNNRICWILLIQFVDAEEAAEQRFRNSEWGPESNDMMAQEFRDFPHPFGGTIGELIDATPKQSQSKVFLEEKMFETWHYGRAALLGDACHKMIPAGGQGAINAMQDAVILSNVFYDMPDASSKSIDAAFRSYRAQRYDHAKMELEFSSVLGKLFAGQGFFDRLIRKVLFNYVPYAIHGRQFMKASSYRPQLNWMPQVPNHGTGYVLPQQPSWRYQKELERLKQEGYGVSAV